MRPVENIISFHNKFNKFYNTGARMLGFVYHKILKLFKNHIFGVKKSRYCHHLRNVIWTPLRHVTKSVN